MPITFNPQNNTPAATPNVPAVPAASTDSISDRITQAIKGAFDSIVNLFTSLQNRLNNLVAPHSDEMKLNYIRSALTAMQGDELQTCLDKFSHISSLKAQLEAFKDVQEQSTPEAALAFYHLLPVDVQNHLDRHIWIANGRNDAQRGIHFGRYTAENDITHNVVKIAISQYLAEVKNPRLTV